MPKIQNIHAFEILDSRGVPTIEVAATLEDGIVGIGRVPSGASTGVHEAVEMRDGNAKRYSGKGVLSACEKVKTVIASALKGMEGIDQEAIDKKLIALDGTPNKSALGANAILGTSLAVAHAAAKALEKPMYEYIAAAYDFPVFNFQFPTPMFNIVNGGRHAQTQLKVQEFMVVPYGIEDIREKIRAGSEVFYALRDILLKNNLMSGVGDEGGFSPDIALPEDALRFIAQAIMNAGYNFDQVGIALDIAASELFDQGKYTLDSANGASDHSALLERYQSWVKNYPVISLEDPFAEDDWKAWQEFLLLSLSFESEMSFMYNHRLMIVGDDLFVTNVTRVQKGASENAANAVLIKPNQIGTLTETIQCVKFAKSCGFDIVISHRSGETCDSVIADIAVASGAGFIKAGAPCRGERIAKYNRLIEIANEVG